MLESSRYHTYTRRKPRQTLWLLLPPLRCILQKNRTTAYSACPHLLFFLHCCCSTPSLWHRFLPKPLFFLLILFLEHICWQHILQVIIWECLWFALILGISTGSRILGWWLLLCPILKTLLDLLPVSRSLRSSTHPFKQFPLFVVNTFF